MQVEFSNTNRMLLTIGLALMVLWFVGFIIFPVVGWFIHILLIIAIITILAWIIRGSEDTYSGRN